MAPTDPQARPLSPARRRLVGWYNQAIDAAERGDPETAAKRFEELATSASDPTLREKAAANAATARNDLKRVRDVAAFNAAIGRANAGDYAAAIAGLEKLLAADPDAKLEAEARKILGELRAIRGKR